MMKRYRGQNWRCSVVGVGAEPVQQVRRQLRDADPAVP